MKNNKYFNCFSINLLRHIRKYDIHPIRKLTHDGTGKDFWVYIRSADLDKALSDYTKLQQKVSK
jgi:hypothetical protein